MRARWFIGLLLLAALVTGCRLYPAPQFDLPEEEEPTLGLAIEFPRDYETRGEVGELPGTQYENELHSVGLWVFRSDDHSLVTSRTLTEDEFPVGGGIRRYSLPVSKDFANQAPDVDVFVLANAEAIDISLDEDASWATLNNLYFQDTETDPYHGFGISHPVHLVDETLGLPMSVVGKNMPITGEAPVLRVETVRLQRTVSRLRYVFCKTRTIGEEGDEVAIQQIVLNGAQIPVKEYVFTTGKTGIVLDQEETEDNYVVASYITPGPTTLAENDNPENLIYINQDPITYRRMLD